MSEGLGWTTPKAILDEESDVTKIQIFPHYLPAGDEDDAIELIIGRGKKGKEPLSLSIRRVILDKKVEKIVAQKNEFLIDKKFDNVLMIEIFASKVVVFHDETTLLIDAARVGRSELIASILDSSGIDVNAKNFKGESALLAAAKSPNNDALKTLLKHGKGIDFSVIDDKGNTVLHHAVKHGTIETLDILAAKFVNMSLDQPWKRNQNFHLTENDGHLEQELGDSAECSCRFWSV